MTRWLLPLCLACSALTGTLRAHPITPQHHDRHVLVRLTADAVHVEYTLALDSATMFKDLLPFADKVDWQGQQKKIEQGYAEIYGPRIAEGIFAQTESRELELKLVRYQIKSETDHWKFVFHLAAPLKLGERPVHRLLLTDSNFATQAGAFKLAARSEGVVEITESNVASDLEKAKEHKLQGFTEKDEEQRTARIRFRVNRSEAPAAAPTSPPSAEAPQMDEDFWSTLRSQSLTRLVQSRLGLGLLLILAFMFGAFHAMQPGHGKTLVAAYLVGERGTILHAIYLGLVTTLTHTGMVIVLALVVPLIVPDAESEITIALMLVCGLIVVLMACWLLLKRIAGEADHVHLFGGHHHHDGPHHQHHHHEPHTHAGEGVGWGALTLLGMTGGLVPCVDALALVTATWVTRQHWLGLPLILVFSLGLASVLVLVGVLVVKFKQYASSGEGRWTRVLPIVSALLTLALGLWMCHEAWRMWEGTQALR
jgi:ABC-type nickel/cobalt efflux system permease component RcnA